MLRVVLEGWTDKADPDQIRVLIRDATGISAQAARSQTHRLQQGDTVILSISPDYLSRFLHDAERLGIRTASMLVGKVHE